MLHPTQISLADFDGKISFSSRGKKREVFQTNDSLPYNPAQNILHTRKRPSVSSPEKMEQTLLLAGRRHASFLCSSSSLSLSKKLKKNIRGGGGGALFIFCNQRQFFQIIGSFLFSPTSRSNCISLTSYKLSGGDRVLGGKKSPKMSVKNKAIADPSFTTSSEENNNNNNNNNKEATTVIPTQKHSQGVLQMRSSSTGRGGKKEGKKCQKVKPQI